MDNNFKIITPDILPRKNHYSIIFRLLLLIGKVYSFLCDKKYDIRKNTSRCYKTYDIGSITYKILVSRRQKLTKDRLKNNLENYISQPDNTYFMIVEVIFERSLNSD